nr:hypothetical protein [Deinococcus wulumuqiensis]
MKRLAALLLPLALLACAPAPKSVPSSESVGAPQVADTATFQTVSVQDLKQAVDAGAYVLTCGPRRNSRKATSRGPSICRWARSPPAPGKCRGASRLRHLPQRQPQRPGQRDSRGPWQGRDQRGRRDERVDRGGVWDRALKPGWGPA